jgi:probable F420-dependent oxidoreductase
VPRRIPASRGCARLGAVKIGLAALGIGRGARPATLQAVARAADATGFATLWMGQHVVLFDRHDSRYPYSERGEFAVPATTDWLDPFVTLSAAATITSRIRLATGICLVPQHNPLILAKQVASLDRLSDGRFVFGIGIGWLAEEFAALGIPFARRAERTREYVALMRRLWSEEVTTFHGEFASVDGVRSFPKPVRGGRLPVILGGESRAALTRAAEYGDGWHGFNLSPEEAAERIAVLRSLLQRRERDPAAFEIVVAPFTKPVRPADLARYHAAGVHEVTIVATPPLDESRMTAWVEDLANEWVRPAASLV